MLLFFQAVARKPIKNRPRGEHRPPNIGELPPQEHKKQKRGINMDTDKLFQLQGLIDAVQIAADAGAHRDIITRALMCVSEYIDTVINAGNKAE